MKQEMASTSSMLAAAITRLGIPCMCSDKVMGDQGSVQSHLDHPVAPVLQREEAGHDHCGADSRQGEPQHGRPGPGEAQQEVGGEGHLSHHHHHYDHHHHSSYSLQQSP